MQDAAAKYGVDFCVLTDRVTDVPATLEQINQLKPDGLIAIGMDFDIRPWIELCQKRGEIPRSPTATSCTWDGAWSRFASCLTCCWPTRRASSGSTRACGCLCPGDVNHLKVLDCPCEGYDED